MCDTLVVVGPHQVLFAKNSDRDPNEAQILEWHARARHPRGARLACTHITIAQADETHAVLLSRPFWMWGAEIGTNEHGVTIGNQAVFTTQPYAKSGLTGMDLLRLALERADTAERAVHVICSMLEAHGQGGGCGLEDRGFTYHNSFVIADPNGAFVLETAGRYFAVERVQGARSISNGLTIPGFAEKHGDFVKSHVSACRSRRARSEALARAAVTANDLMRVLRDHGASNAWPAYAMMNGAMSAPCMHAGGLLAAAQTTGSWVAELRPGRSRHWATGTAAPCTGLFKPVRVDEPIALGAPTERPDADSLWWRHERLHRAVMQDPARLAPLFVNERDLIERELHDAAPRDAFARGDQMLEAWTDRVARERVFDVRPRFVRGYWRRRA